MDIEYVSQQALSFELMLYNEHCNKYILEIYCVHRDKIKRAVLGILR
jgi:hypothetical protein